MYVSLVLEGTPHFSASCTSFLARNVDHVALWKRLHFPSHLRYILLRSFMPGIRSASIYLETAIDIPQTPSHSATYTTQCSRPRSADQQYSHPS